MNSLPQPDKILTHESDLDGLLSGLLLQRLAKHIFHKEILLEAWNYTGWKMRPMREKSAWVCDLSFESRLDQDNWVIIDHHTTNDTAERAHLIHDLEKSASLLCYELCQQHGVQSEALDRIVHLSNIADLYLEKDPEFDLAVDYANLVKAYGFWNLHSLINGDPEKLLDHSLLEVIRTKRKIEDPIGLAWTRRHLHRLSDTVGFAETVVGDVNSIVHNLLGEPDAKYKVLVTMFTKANRTVMASFRSLNGEALGIARQFQGGGHANACGATLPKAVSSVDEAIVYMRQILNPTPAKGAGLASLESAFAALDKLN